MWHRFHTVLRRCRWNISLPARLAAIGIVSASHLSPSALKYVRCLVKDDSPSATSDKELHSGRSLLTAAEVETYKREGWLLPQIQIPPEIIAELHMALDRAIAQNPGIRPERLTAEHLAETNAEGCLGASKFFDVAMHPLILDVMKQLLGPGVCLWGCQIFCKPPSDGMEVPMHQDAHYWEILASETATVWIALDRSDVSNGCLHVLPKSHTNKQRFAHDERRDVVMVAAAAQAIKKAALNQLEPPVAVELNPGQFSIHDVYIVHGSSANTSARRRAGIALRFGSESVATVLDREWNAS